MPLLKRVSVLAAKIEGTPGTAETLAASDADYVVFDASIQPNIEFDERPSQGSMSHHPSIGGARGGTVSFSTELFGDGAAGTPEWASAFLPACGWVESTGTFSPTSEAPGSNVKTLTIGVYQNGVRKLLKGCMGTFDISITSGKRIMFNWTFTGVWAGTSDTAILTPTYPTTKPLRAANATWSIGSWNPVIESMTISAGNNVVLRESTLTTEGYITALVTDRKVTGSFNPEMALVATQDNYGDWLTSTESAFSYAVTDGTDTITIAAPKWQITNVQEGDRNGIITDDIEFCCNKSAAAGDDELTIDFS